MIGDPPPAPRRAHRAVLALAWVGGAFAVLLVFALVAAVFIRLPYVVVGPGPVTPLDDDVLAIEDAPTYEHDGDLLFLTVSLSRGRPNVYRVLQGLLDRSSDVEPEMDYFGEEPPRDHTVLSTLLMGQSQIAARVLALDVLGYDVVVTPIGALVQAIEPEGTARGTLRLGDSIVAIDGEETPTASAVSEAIRGRAPGDEIAVAVDRHDSPDDEARLEDLTLTIGELGGEPAIGVLLVDFLEEPDFPVSITLDTRRVTGSSAGLAFTLAIIDAMSPGDLTGGHDVAVTGAIALDGRVTRVGGIKYKAEAARAAGAALLLVPASELEVAERHADSLEVVGVETLDDALAALAALGGELPDGGGVQAQIAA